MKYTGPETANKKVVLYVGGRRRLYDKLRSLAADAGATLFFHDGGLEDNTTLLQAYVAKADIVVFPVDHISHAAMSITKRLCLENKKAFIPMRTAGLASFASTISTSPL